jgi:large subunit ribosomal protein L53
VHAIAQQLKQVDLRPVKRITYKFDPFHPNTKEFRNLMYYMSIATVRQTNYKCNFKTEVLSDMSEPEMLCKLENGSQLRFVATNLTTLEILEELNRIVLPLAPPPEDEEVEVPKTKSQKKR